MSVEGGGLGSGEAAGPENIGAASPEAGEQWQDDSRRAEADFDKGTEKDPADAEPLINEADPDRLAESRQEREAVLLSAIDLVKEASDKELAERYKLNDGNAISKFIKNVSVFFAGERRDIDIAKEVAELDPEQREEAIKTALNFFSRESARRIGKNLVKTAVTGGVGAGITAVLGGAVASPAFLAALAGGAVFRGVYELLRQFDLNEQESRFKAIEARADVFAYAARLKQEEGVLLDERGSATPERQAEIDAEIKNMQIQLVAELKYKSEENIYSEGDEGEKATIRGMEKVFELGKAKNTLERKREKTADLIAAGGSIIGGFAGSFVVDTFQRTTQEAAQGFAADFDKDTVEHFVRHITPNQVASTSQEGFSELLRESGGYVFQYNPGELAAKTAEAAKYGYEMTTATLNSGEVVHTLSGMTDSRFAELLGKVPGISTEVVTQTVFNTAGFFREAVPVAAANMAFFVRNLFAGRGEPPKTPSDEGSVTDRAWEQWEAGAAAAQQEPSVPGSGPKYDEEVRVPINGGISEEKPAGNEEATTNFDRFDNIFQGVSAPESKEEWEGVETMNIKEPEPGVETRRIVFSDKNGHTYYYSHTVNNHRDAIKRDHFSLNVFDNRNNKIETHTELNQQQLDMLTERINKKRKKQ